MPESIMQALYAVLATAGLVLLTRTIIADHFSDVAWLQRKPFSCSYCLCFWWAIVVLVALNLNTTPVEFVLSLVVVHISAYIVLNRLT